MKRITGITLALVFLCSLIFSISLFIPEAEPTMARVSPSGVSPKKQTGTFRYIKDYTDIYYYDDEYFFNDASEYNPSLATMSFCLALSSFSVEEEHGDTDYTNNYDNVKDLLDDLNFKDFAVNEWYSEEPSAGTIAVAVANRTVLDGLGFPYTIVAVAVRGGGYGKEWASNFTIGETGAAEGFENAKEQVLDFIKEYISSVSTSISKDLKFWICGFSRGAATANLVAAEITDNPKMFGQGIKTTRQDIFAYCFATPMGALKENTGHGTSSYDNIRNIINLNDPIPYVAPSALGFDRYGSDHYFPDITTHPEEYPALQEEMESHYSKLATFPEAGEYSIDEFRMKRINMVELARITFDSDYAEKKLADAIEDDTYDVWTQGEFLKYSIDALAEENIKDRSTYVNDFQSGIVTIFDTLHGSVFSKYPEDASDNCFNVFLKKLKDPINIAIIIYDIFNSDSDSVGAITTLLTESINECGMEILPEEAKELEEFGKAAISLIAKFALNHPNLTVTLLSNMEHIGSGHNHELYFAWLKTEDKNYTLPANTSPSSGNR